MYYHVQEDPAPVHLATEFMSGFWSVLRTPTVLNASPDILAENVYLYLPSELSSTDHDQACTAGVAEAEAWICHVYASEGLDVCSYLCTHTCLNKWCIKNVVGQHQGTHSCGLHHHTEIKVQAAKTHYKHARKAILINCGPGSRSWHYGFFRMSRCLHTELEGVDSWEKE